MTKEIGSRITSEADSRHARMEKLRLAGLAARSEGADGLEQTSPMDVSQMSFKSKQSEEKQLRAVRADLARAGLPSLDPKDAKRLEDYVTTEQYLLELDRLNQELARRLKLLEYFPEKDKTRKKRWYEKLLGHRPNQFDEKTKQLRVEVADLRAQAEAVEEKLKEHSDIVEELLLEKEESELTERRQALDSRAGDVMFEIAKMERELAERRLALSDQSNSDKRRNELNMAINQTAARLRRAQMELERMQHEKNSLGNQQ